MLTLKYFAHLILHSRYKLFINLFVISIIYIFLYSDKVIYCMNTNPDIGEIPPVAEAKETHRPSHQVIALRRNIQAYAGTLASHLESRDQIIDEFQEEIRQLKSLIFNQNNDIQTLKRDNETLQSNLKAAHARNIEKGKTINDLNKAIEGVDWFPESGYKGKITKMEKQIVELRRDLHISETLLAEAKRDKERLFSLISQTIEKK